MYILQTTHTYIYTNIKARSFFFAITKTAFYDYFIDLCRRFSFLVLLPFPFLQFIYFNTFFGGPVVCGSDAFLLLQGL